MVESLHSYEALPPVFTHVTNPEVRSLHTHRASVSVVLLDFIIINLAESSRLAVQPAKVSEVPPVHAPRMQNADAVVSSVEATGRPQTTRLPETRRKSTPSWWAASLKSPAKENRSSESAHPSSLCGCVSVCVRCASRCTSCTSCGSGASDVPPLHAPRLQDANVVVSSVEAASRQQSTGLPTTTREPTPH